MKREPAYVVVVGASPGGFNALVELVSQLNPELDAAYFVVLHLSCKNISGFLAHKLQEHTLTKVPPPQETQAPADVALEVEPSEKVLTDIAHTAQLGRPTVYTCPDCGGVLFQHTQDPISKYKCHIGHSFTVRDLVKKQNEEVEDSLWHAIRSPEQRRNLLATLAERFSKTGNRFMASDYEKRVDELRNHIDNLKGIISSNMKEPEDSQGKGAGSRDQGLSIRD